MALQSSWKNSTPNSKRKSSSAQLSFSSSSLLIISLIILIATVNGKTCSESYCGTCIEYSEVGTNGDIQCDTCAFFRFTKDGTTLEKGQYSDSNTIGSQLCSNTLLICTIVGGSVLIVALLAVGIFFFLMRKKKPIPNANNTQNQPSQVNKQPNSTTNNGNESQLMDRSVLMGNDQLNKSYVQNTSPQLNGYPTANTLPQNLNQNLVSASPQIRAVNQLYSQNDAMKQPVQQPSQISTFSVPQNISQMFASQNVPQQQIPGPTYSIPSQQVSQQTTNAAQNYQSVKPQMAEPALYDYTPSPQRYSMSRSSSMYDGQTATTPKAPLAPRSDVNKSPPFVHPEMIKLQEVQRQSSRRQSGLSYSNDSFSPRPSHQGQVPNLANQPSPSGPGPNLTSPFNQSAHRSVNNSSYGNNFY